MLVYPAALSLSLSRQTLTYTAGVIRRHRKQIGSCWRKLSPGQQALLVLAYLRKGETFAELAAGFGIGTATAWRYVTETVALLAGRSPRLRTALRDAKKAGHAYVVLDGTLIPIDRVAADRPFYSGKHRRHGMNLQPTTPARMTHDYVRHGTTSLFAALNLASGSVIAQPYRGHRHQEFLRFLELIDAAVPKGLDPHLVLDNYATHKTPAIHQWLLKHPRLHLHFTPTSSSWMNLVERWFAELTSRKLRRSAHRSVTDLETDIREWINEWNKNPKPFAWTKTADEILETLAAYCQCIIDSGC